jgi:hypothetical protein
LLIQKCLGMLRLSSSVWIYVPATLSSASKWHSKVLSHPSFHGSHSTPFMLHPESQFLKPLHGPIEPSVRPSDVKLGRHSLGTGGGRSYVNFSTDLSLFVGSITSKRREAPRPDPVMGELSPVLYGWPLESMRVQLRRVKHGTLANMMECTLTSLESSFPKTFDTVELCRDSFSVAAAVLESAQPSEAVAVPQY